MPTRAGTDSGGRQTGHDGDRYVGGRAGQQLLEAAAEHEAVPALEADDPLAGAGAGDDDLVDGVLRRGAAAGQLGHVDQLHVRSQLVEQLARRQPVGHDDVRRGERVAGGDGDEVGLAGTTADQHHTRTPVVGVGRREVTVAQGRDDVVAQRRRLPWLAIAEHADGQAPVVPDGGRPCGAAPSVVGPHAEGVPLLGGSGDPGVDCRVVGRRDDVPRTVDVGLGEVAQQQRQLAGQPLQRGGDLGADQRDLRAGGQEGRHPTLRHVSPSDHDHLAPGQHEPGEVGMGVGHGSIVSGPPVGTVARFEG